METDAAIRQLKVVFRQYQFTDWSEEIYFFKNTKPQFVAVYIYYSKILSIEASKPFSDTMVLGPTMKMKEVIFYIFMVSRRNLSITTEGNRLFWIKNISSVSNLTLSSS
ncbi:RteC domain-containing protein [Epilithonimonas sp. UC225_85]|uniref:RteC domain-containing protein n=1 Tax=Epilithonimonas sp. UC225_85 TaxID=3350167 RepID=UPI0036D3AE15